MWTYSIEGKNIQYNEYIVEPVWGTRSTKMRKCLTLTGEVWECFTEEIFEQSPSWRYSTGKGTLCRGNYIFKNSEGGESILWTARFFSYLESKECVFQVWGKWGPGGIWSEKVGKQANQGRHLNFTLKVTGNLQRILPKDRREQI